MTAAEAMPPDPSPSLDEIADAIDAHVRFSGEMAALMARWRAGDFSAGAEIVRTARLFS